MRTFLFIKAECVVSEWVIEWVNAIELMVYSFLFFCHSVQFNSIRLTIFSQMNGKANQCVHSEFVKSTAIVDIAVAAAVVIAVALSSA